MLADAPNIQSLWGDLIVEELVRNGVDHFIVCPGSRSTPLVQAVARHPEARATIWNDERGGAFHALGIGRVAGPAAIVTTSGTAVANLLPAVVEASLDGVPLILLTADRPHELREVGANQSVRQTRMFADHARWSFDLPVPDDRTPARSVLTTVDHAVFMAERSTHPGPVQLNCPFREPLAPSAAPWDAGCLEGLDRWLANEAPFTWTEETIAPCPLGDEWLGEFAAELSKVTDGLIVVGDIGYGSGIDALAHATGWPVWTDARTSYAEGMEPPHRMDHVDRLLGRGFEPTLVLQLGSRPMSKRLQTWLDAGGAEHYIVVDPTPERIDPGHRVTHRFVTPVDHWCDAVWEALREYDKTSGPSEALCQAHEAIQAAIRAGAEEGSELSEPWLAQRMTHRMPSEGILFVSNSMPIRDVQTFGRKDPAGPRIIANRGASGIDGIVSTAAGVARGAEQPVTLLIGDLALQHDINALAHIRALEQPLTIVVVNNGGGGIFSFLPIAEHEDVLRPYVETPHAVTFEGVCASFDLPYAHVDTRDGFEAAYKAAVESGTSSLLEVKSDIAANKAHHDRLEAAIEAAIEGA